MRFGLRVSFLVVWLGVAALFAGCQSFSKRPDDAANNRDPLTARNEQPFWANNDTGSRLNGSAPNAPISRNATDAPGTSVSAEPTGVLAGRVVDPSSRPVGAAMVQVASAEGGEAPREIETTPQGHFVVRGLVPGRTYKLIAKLKQDGKPVMGELIARPPDARLLIPVSAEFVTTQPTAPPAQLGSPRNDGNFLNPPAAPEVIAGNPSAMPQASIPGLPNTTTPAIQFGPAQVSGPVPDCLVNGNRVLTLRLSDPDGRTWDFSQHQGRLVLLDLWGTWCTPCLKAIPDLARLQQQYRQSGLEVIGIACEEGTAGENLARVQAARRKMPFLNYRLLIAGPAGKDPVREQFAPRGYPTLVLVDNDGTILWRGTGSNSLSEVEPLIRQRLATRSDRR